MAFRHYTGCTRGYSYSTPIGVVGDEIGCPWPQQEAREEKLSDKITKTQHYLGPLREPPKRTYTWTGARPGDVGPKGERLVEVLLAARERGDYITSHKNGAGRKVSLEVRVAEWLQALSLIHSFDLRPVSPGSRIFQVLVRRGPRSPEVLLTDVGFGVSQILPVIALCYYVPKGAIVVLEQPEIHLHPSVQAGLADIFIDAIRSQGIQIVLESHSEHLLRRLQRRIAEEAFSPEEAAIYFCEHDGQASHLEHLHLDPFGNIENWPEDFFGDDFGEIAAMSEAAIRRRQKEPL